MAKAKKSKAKKPAAKKKTKKVKKTAKRAAAKRAAAKRAAAKRAAAKRAPVKKSKAKKSKKTAKPAKAKKAAPKKKQKLVGEGDYAASRTFLKDQSNFVKKNKAKIPEMGRQAERALDGPEGDSLRAAEQEAMNRSTID